MGNQKKFNRGVIIGLAILILAALGIIGVLAYQNYQLRQQTTQNQPIPIIDDWCSSAKTHGECIERGCKALFMETGSKEPWCVP